MSLAYTRVDMVEKRGEIAVRGGMLDLFPPTADHPVRVEFFGDEITDIRTFGVIDQRSLSAIETVTAPPCREILLTAEVRARAAALSAQNTGDPTLAQMLDNLSNGISVEGMESLIPVLVGDELELLPNLVRPGHPCACWPTRNGSAPGPPTWSGPATSSSRRPGWRRPPVAGRRSTWARRRTGAWRTPWMSSGTPNCRSGGSRRSTPATPSRDA